MSNQQTKSGSSNNPKPIPENEIKQNSSVSASMALQAAQKAYELRQAANAAGDPNAREEILAKAINKEIEAESFGKAAKYTRSGTFQGLAAGAGLGVQPGVTLGKLTGALVGGTVSTVTGLLGGGIGSVYGAMYVIFRVKYRLTIANSSSHLGTVHSGILDRWQVKESGVLWATFLTGSRRQHKRRHWRKWSCRQERRKRLHRRSWSR